MLKSKKTEVLLVILIVLSISGFYIIQDPSTITKLFLIDSRAITQPLSLSVGITGCQEETFTIGASGQVIPSISCNYDYVPKITGLTGNIGDDIKIRAYISDTTPVGFTAPATTQVVTVYNYFNITLENTLVGTATILFNITKANLGTTDTDDIRLYRYDTSWIELTTTVIDSTADPVEFSAETDSFSPFLIGEKAEGAAVITLPLGGPISKGGLKLGLEKPVTRPKPVKLIIPTLKKVIEKIIKLPAHLLKYEISYKVIYITVAALLIIIIALEIIYYYIHHKRH